MTLSLRGTSENSATNGNDVTLTHPGGIATDDVVYVGYCVRTGDVDLDMSVTTSGYTELADLYADNNRDANLGVFRKKMGETPDSTVVCVGSGNSFEATTAVEHVWDGVDTTTPEDATTTTATAIGDPTAPNGPAITTVTANAVVLTFAAHTDRDDTVTAPSGYGNQVDIGETETRNCMVAMASIAVASPSEEDPQPWTDWTTNAANAWCTATVAIRPAAGGAAVAYVMFPTRMDGIGRGGIFAGNRVQ